MDFFEHQAQAQRQTRFLIFMFILALIAIVITVDLVALTLLVNLDDPSNQLIIPGLQLIQVHQGVIILTSLGTVGLIGMASLYRIATLGGGGGKVARSLGGTLVSPDTRDPLRRRLLNVVEEMAIASGVPMPEVYVLEEEQGLNAFAAGFTPGDAAIAVTRGSLEAFSRNELQGVIAHEFSHVLNGDMRLNMRLMGILFGILVISLIGRTILRSLRHARFRSSRSSSKGGGGVAAVVALGAALAVIGYVGLFFARLIKAGMSRQREYLADASAVQFTRQTEGIAGALKKIGYGASSQIEDSDGEEISHMLFANGLGSLSRLYATHPPIEERIRALEPGFDPAVYLRDQSRQTPTHERASEAERTQAEPDDRKARAQWGRLMESLLILTPDAVSDSIGNPQDQHIRHAAELRRLIPEQVYQATQSRIGALLLTLSLLLDRDNSMREQQLAHLSSYFEVDALSLIRQLRTEVERLGPQYRLPLLDIAFPALKQRPREQIDAMLKLIDELITTDGRVDSFEYLLSRSLIAHLHDAERPQRTTTGRGGKLVNSLEELHTLFSVLARLGHEQGDAAARDAYQVGMLSLLPNSIDWPEYNPPEKWVEKMDAALERLDGLPVVAKEELVKALTVTISHDARVTVGEAELLRAVCAILHCPLPPFVLDTHTNSDAGQG
ncbi:MAG: M48 family metallopeptidase [Gammaproteobacteria bacterium]|nr:M48 family metallopeptidase [Gammaproteobacteria bacterium]